MAPIEQNTIIVEDHTLRSGWRRFRKEKRIYAKGTPETPGTFRYKCDLFRRPPSKAGSIVDVAVDKETGQIIEDKKGVWEKVVEDYENIKQRVD